MEGSDMRKIYRHLMSFAEVSALIFSVTLLLYFTFAFYYPDSTQVIGTSLGSIFLVSAVYFGNIWKNIES